MRTLIVEGRVIRAGKYESAQDSPKITVAIPFGPEPIDDEDYQEEHLLDMDTDEETAKHFAAHLFDRVRVSITIIPTPQLVDDGAEEDSTSEVRRPREPGRVQDDNEAS